MADANKQTHNKAIIAWLKAGHTITPLEALKKWRCFRLGARIWELKHEHGYQIGDRYVRNEETGTRYKEYWLVKKES